MAVPSLSLATRQRLLFAVLCFVWGTTFLALKIGVTAVPPAFYSGVRWTAAGVLLLAWRRVRGQRVLVRPRLLLRVVPLALVLVGVCSAVQLYGLREVSSGLGAVISSALTPITMLIVAVALGQERLEGRHLLGLGIGIGGILVLFGPAAISGDMGKAALLGAALVAFGTVLYCVGAVGSRRLLRIVPPAQLAGLTNLFGGLALLVFSLPLEPGAWQAANLAWGWEVWLGWLWLVFAGSLGASIIYFLLMRDWGASRTGSYAFISPVISVLAGMAVLHEHVSLTEAVGMLLMLAGAGLSLGRSPPRRGA